MFQKIDFSKLGGFPLTQKTMLYVQDSYNDVLEALARAIGNYVIISGVTVIGTDPMLLTDVYSSGWVTYDNKILPFAGGSELNFVNLITSNTSETFNNGNTFQVTTGYTAIFDTVNNGVTFSQFQRLSLTDLKTYIDNVNITAVNAQSTANAALLAASGGLPIGAIVLWSGSIASIASLNASGWFLCDGGNGTVDLRDRFVVGAGSMYTVAATGGFNTVTLSLAQMPSHTHTINGVGTHQHYVREVSRGEEGTNGTDQSVGSYTEGGTDKFTNPAGAHTHTMNSAGSDTAHENRPPYYALAYIQKIL